MDRNEFIEICNKKIKLIRTEYNFSQEKMAEILGISKKTLVEIEKGRSSLGWTGSVALCTIFPNSEIFAAAFGGGTADIIMALAFNGDEPHYPKTMGGKVWWQSIDVEKGFKIQQNIISRHYRILDKNDCRICSSLDFENIRERFSEVIENGESGQS